VLQAYATEISEASRVLAAPFIADLDGLEARVAELDGDVLKLAREVGRQVVSRLLSTLSSHVVTQDKTRGLTVHRREDISVRTVLGRVRVDSPYLRNKATRETSRPIKTRLGLVGAGMTVALERALTDFGAEESFEMASKRLEEHYGMEVGRTTILRVVERRAREAGEFIDQRLADAREAFGLPLAERPGAANMLVEMDGCMIRMGTLAATNDGGTTKVRGLPARKREEGWREVRVAFARQPEEVDRTYVASMDTYQNVVGELFDAAVERGLSERTQVFAVCDGGNGLREELDVQFDGLKFLLDRPHLKAHLYEAAAAAGADPERQRTWVASALELIDLEHVGDVIEVARQYADAGVERMGRLAGYLTRFSDALDYTGAKAAGIPLGSGEIESAHRYIPQKRLKIPGACWHPDTINPMLALRVLRANDWWDDFWASRLQPRAAA